MDFLAWQAHRDDGVVDSLEEHDGAVDFLEEHDGVVDSLEEPADVLASSAQSLHSPALRPIFLHLHATQHMRPTDRSGQCDRSSRGRAPRFRHEGRPSSRCPKHHLSASSRASTTCGHPAQPGSQPLQLPLEQETPAAAVCSERCQTLLRCRTC